MPENKEQLPTIDKVVVEKIEEKIDEARLLLQQHPTGAPPPSLSQTEPSVDNASEVVKEPSVVSEIVNPNPDPATAFQKPSDVVGSSVKTTVETTRYPLASTAINTTENRASTTTAEEDLRTAGQRTINKVWEYTQSYIAIMVISITGLGVFIGRVFEAAPQHAFPAEWWTIVGLVIGFYFSRTNHARTGDQERKTSGGLDDR